MPVALRVALVGDYDPSVIAHQAIPEALRLSSTTTCAVEGVWVHTNSIRDPKNDLAGYDGIWCVPASPYANMDGALGAIQYARESGRPFLGTCGGFQHSVIEYARNVCGLLDANHAETDSAAGVMVVSPLACPLVEQNEEIILREGSLVKKAYGTARITEAYHCSYGLNKDYEALLFAHRLHATAHDATGGVRAVELPSHPFFVATLFQHERRALQGGMPPLVKAFVDSLTAMSHPGNH